MLPRLPIDDVLPALCDAVRAHGVAVLVAPPGAGKTTRVPTALLDAGLCGEGQGVVVLQPRRLAARLAAARVADERGTSLGDEIGFEVRFDRQRSANTRCLFVTEGILTRRLVSEPDLPGIGCVIVDEFHERHLDGDLALAMLVRLRERRPDLRLLVMSATLDAAPVAEFLGAPVVRSEGRAHPVAIEYAPAISDQRLATQVVGAVRRVLARPDTDGDILVFLPGAGEIRFCQDDLAASPVAERCDIVPLHGDLPLAEQDRAVRRSSRRKIILATNVAETSVTIDGVTVVIDTGVARVARTSPWTGVSSLQLEPISRASATQRAGRAGRTRPGICVRLYDAHDHDTRRAFDAPEIERADLASLVLDLASLGVRPEDVRWYQAPPTAALVSARTLLQRLGACREDGTVTPLGRALQRLPAHPRQARILLECARLNLADEGAVIAALLGQREVRLERRGRAGVAKLASPSDVLEDLDALLDARDRGMRPEAVRSAGLEPATAHATVRAAKQLAGTLERLRLDSLGLPPLPSGILPAARASDATAIDRALRYAILTGFPDRVGRRRAPRSADVVFAGGGAGVLAPSSTVVDDDLMVAVDVAEVGERGKATRVTIRRASAIEASWLLDAYLDAIDETDALVWNPSRERVERVRRMLYDGLIVDEDRDDVGARQQPEAAARVLADAALAVGLERFVDAEGLALWRTRLAFAASHAPAESGLAPPSDAALAEALAGACVGLVSFAELRKAGLLALFAAAYDSHRALIDRLAPAQLALPNGRRVKIHYETDRPPWIASRMQDFFGLARAPSVAGGRVPLVLHLLAPNQRPVQVTQDLPGFWVRHYPALRRELMRKYPKHKWPESPLELVTEE